jgi:hypothetical protein
MTRKPVLRYVELKEIQILTTIEFNGLPLFNTVLNKDLRAWNRLNVIFNMKEMLNNSRAQEYVTQFKGSDLVEIGKMAIRVKKNGYENTRREIMRKNNA